MLKSLDRVEAIDRHTVRFTLKEPFAWFLDMLASPMAVCIVARECVEKFGDLRSPEATVGTGPWMFESYRPNVGMTLVRNPNYFVAGLPYIDRVEAFVDEDNASRMAAFLGGKYDLGWEASGTINRVDWVQIRDNLRRRRPNLQTAEFPANVVNNLAMRTDKAPFNDVRVRRAMSMAIDRSAIVDATLEGVGVMNPAVPAGLKEWSIPLDQLGEGERYLRYDPAEAKKLLAEAGHSRGFPATIDFATYGSTVLSIRCKWSSSIRRTWGSKRSSTRMNMAADSPGSRPASTTRWCSGPTRRSWSRMDSSFSSTTRENRETSA